MDRLPLKELEDGSDEETPLYKKQRENPLKKVRSPLSDVWSQSLLDLFQVLWEIFNLQNLTLIPSYPFPHIHHNMCDKYSPLGSRNNIF